MKNKFLLLTGAVTLALTAANVSAGTKNFATANIATHVDIYSAITAEDGVINFNEILAKKNGKVVLNKDGTYGTETDVVTVSTAGTIKPVQFKGGNIAPDGSNYSRFSGVLSATDNHLHDVNDSTIDCGSVALNEMSVETEADAEYGGIKMTPIGANFTMVSNIETIAANNNLECMGNITLTLVYSY